MWVSTQSPDAASHAEVTHSLEGTQTLGATTQAPATQVSTVHGSLSAEHAVPSAFAGWVQVPVLDSHVPTSWHWSSAVHETGFDPTHAPATQVSVCEHALPSLQPVPSAAGA